MNKKLLILFITIYITIYITSFELNFMSSIKHPDLSISIYGLTASLIFVVAIITVAIKASATNKVTPIFFTTGFIAGVIVFIIKTLEATMTNYAVLDIIASIQYPLYLLFITPLFGLNYLMGLDYGVFSIVIASLYGGCFVINKMRAK